MAKARKKFSPAQLAAQRRFAEMAKSGQLKKKASAARKRKNQLGPAIVSGIGYALGSKVVESGADSGTPKRKNFSFSGLFGKKKKTARRAVRGRKRKPTREQMNKAYRAHFGAARKKALKEISPARFGRNPKGQHLPGLSPSYQRMYEHIVQSPEAKKHYGDRLKEVAARTVRKAAAAGILPNSFYRANPGFFRGFRVIQRGARKGRQKVAKLRSFRFKPTRSKALSGLGGRVTRMQKRRLRRRNQSADSLFKEFRGRAPRGRIIEAEGHGPDGKVIDAAELGKLREITLADGRRYEFGGSARLLADGAKRLHVTGVKYRSKPHDAGAIYSITYRADKPHIETGRFDYEHKFGEEGGKRPHWVIDKEGYPCVQGGSYGITADGILN